MRLHQRALIDHARRLCGDHALAEDVVQEVFLKVWHRQARPAGPGRPRLPAHDGAQPAHRPVAHARLPPRARAARHVDGRCDGGRSLGAGAGGRHRPGAPAVRQGPSGADRGLPARPERRADRGGARAAVRHRPVALLLRPAAAAVDAGRRARACCSPASHRPARHPAAPGSSGSGGSAR
nr:sigma factor [Angustibacter aerolatus]